MNARHGNKNFLAGINLNPYQGLKLHWPDEEIYPRRAGINLNPYQGLKHSFFYRSKNTTVKAGINLNPYQGLKQLSFRQSSDVGRQTPEST